MTKPSTIRTDSRRLLTIALIVVASFGPSRPAHAKKDPPPVPDLTQGGQLAETHDWNLGPTGLRGAMWAWSMVTTEARQILVTKVDQGSPADGIVQVERSAGEGPDQLVAGGPPAGQ